MQHLKRNQGRRECRLVHGSGMCLVNQRYRSRILTVANQKRRTLPDMNPDELWRIVYISRLATDFGPDEIEDLLAHSRRRNADERVTGLLVAMGGYFFQVLEGPRAAVHGTFARISTDVRHTDVTTLCDEALAERLFGDWAMACLDASGEHENLPERMGELVTAFAGEVKPHALVSTLLLEFRQRLR
ncbi:MAG: BLUF domain-containing protein [Planctomycetota bacterium]|jgi:hypothetical protein|nr:BLUF domain-containing protein [Planctomycetota bacterium]